MQMIFCCCRIRLTANAMRVMVAKIVEKRFIKFIDCLIDSGVKMC